MAKEAATIRYCSFFFNYLAKFCLIAGLGAERVASGGTPESLGWGRLGLLLGEGWAAKKDGKKGGGKGKIIKEKK